MSNYCLSCCSTLDLNIEHMKARDLRYVCFTYTLDGKVYPDDLGVTMSPEELFRRMEAGAETKTSQVSTGEYIRHFESMLQEGKDILHVTLSTGISGTYNSACIARDELASKYPDRKIYVVDSLSASAGYGLMMDTLADMRDAGKDIDTVYTWIEANKQRMQHWFFTSDLTFFIRGGRVSKVSGWFGTMLNICPLLHVDAEGKLVPMEKARGKRSVTKRIVEKMVQLAENGIDYNGKCYISNAACREDAEAVAALVNERFPKMAQPVKIYSIGTTIGSHTGPGTVAMFFWGTPRCDEAK